MSHHINAIVTNNTDALKGLEFRILPQGFALLLDTAGNRNALKEQSFISIWTDYFGGPGEQGCLLHEGGKQECVCDKCGQLIVDATSADGKYWKRPGPSIPFTKMDSINAGLKALGVIAGPDEDEFDAMTLGRFRENADIARSERQPSRTLDQIDDYDSRD
jgi:hypothetical protein